MAITRVSTAADGTQGDNSSLLPSLSADGTKVAFLSDADNLVPGDTNGAEDLFVKDLATGATTRVSTASDGTQSNADSLNPSLSADGTKVLFQSSADNLVPGDTNGAIDVFVKDLATGATTRVSTAADGTQSNANSVVPAFSADGTKVAFASLADNLVPGDTNGTADVFVKDLATGATTRVSTAADGTQGNGLSFAPSLSADGTKIVFDSAADNLVPGDTNGTTDVFVKDLATGAITRVSTAADGTQADSFSQFAALSADGTKVVFDSDADNLVPGDTNGQLDVFVKDIATGAITRVSAAADGTQGNGLSQGRALSADGTRVAFESDADNLVPGDTNGGTDVFVRDLTTGTITRVSIAADGTQGNGNSLTTSLSGDGTKVAFVTGATNLVPGDTNESADILVADVAPCYAAGTSILIERGEVAVEHLAVGDRVVTASGALRPIRWIGHRRVDLARHPRPETVRPVRVLAGAFGDGLPKRDLWLSPDHAVRVQVLDEVLIPVKHLVNDATIAQVEADTVTYWHVELDSHDILLAEGLPAESFLDTGVRACFENAGAFQVLHPDFTPLSLDDFCLPLVQEGVIVDAVRSRLLARAASLGWGFTAEDDLHVVADGVVVRPEREGATARFTLPAEARAVRLVSRSFVPERIDVTTRDGRRLGVPLRSVSVIDGLGLVRSLPIDHPLLSQGFSFVQQEAGENWRWTDGNAVVPAALWAGATGAVALVIETAPERGTMRAWQAPSSAEAPSAVAGTQSSQAA